MGSVDLVFAFLITETLQLFPAARLRRSFRPCAIRLPVGAGCFRSARSAPWRSWRPPSPDCPTWVISPWPRTILLDDFGASYLVYNLVSAGTCIVSVLAPFVYLRLSKVMRPKPLTLLCIVLGFERAAALTWDLGPWGPLALFLVFAPYAPRGGHHSSARLRCPA